MLSKTIGGYKHLAQPPRHMIPHQEDNMTREEQVHRRFGQRTTKNTPQPPIRERDTTPHKIESGRDPIKNKLPGENNHLKRSSRLPNPRNGPQNLTT